MDMTGQRTLQVTQQQAWEALNDPEILKACIPGCQKFESSGEQKFAVAAGIKMGPVSALFNGSVQLTNIVAPQSYKLNFDAQGGVAGFGKGEAAVEIKPLEKGCDLHYTVHSSVGGKIAQLGQRLVDGVAKNMAEDFFKRFEAELEKKSPPAPEPTILGSAPVPSQVSTGLPAWMWGLGLVVVVAAVAIAYL
jgi:carbon monoxide dehydrogenase subunit G